MEPFEKDRLSESELNELLPRWQAPTAPKRLRAAVFPEHSGPWWRRMWTASVRIPLPVAFACLLLVVFAAARLMRPAPAPRVEVRTQLVETPVIQERIVERKVYVTPEEQTWRPVRELRPRIIRSVQ
jgi:hypothetical protein